MIRTQIQLDEAQSDTLKLMARRNGVSMAEAIRQAIDLYLSQQPEGEELKRRRALDAIGKFEADARLSENHDAFAFNPKGEL